MSGPLGPMDEADLPNWPGRALDAKAAVIMAVIA